MVFASTFFLLLRLAIPFDGFVQIVWDLMFPRSFIKEKVKGYKEKERNKEIVRVKWNKELKWVGWLPDLNDPNLKLTTLDSNLQPLAGSSNLLGEMKWRERELDLYYMKDANQEKENCEAEKENVETSNWLALNSRDQHFLTVYTLQKLLRN